MLIYPNMYFSLRKLINTISSVIFINALFIPKCIGTNLSSKVESEFMIFVVDERLFCLLLLENTRIH
jgi:hypothetical protein